MIQTTVIYESDLGTLSRQTNDTGTFIGLKIKVSHPATTPGFVQLVEDARARGFNGRLQPIDFRADGSEVWVIYPEVVAATG